MKTNIRCISKKKEKHMLQGRAIAPFTPPLSLAPVYVSFKSIQNMYWLGSC